MSALLAAGIAAGTSLLGNVFNLGQAKKQREHQQKLAEYSYQKDLEMWNKSNEYNSPENQMKRLEKARLNPNLVYGNGSVVGNTTTQTPKYQAYTPEYAQVKMSLPMVGQYLNQFQDLKIKKLQADNLGEEINRRKIENSFLGIKLQQEQAMRYIHGQKGYFDIGIGDEEIQGSPYAKKFGLELSKSQGQFKSLELDNKLKQLELNLLGKGVSRSDSVFLRMMVQSGLFDGVLNKLNLNPFKP